MSRNTLLQAHTYEPVTSACEQKKHNWQHLYNGLFSILSSAAETLILLSCNDVTGLCAQVRLKCCRGQGLQGEYCLSPFFLFKHAEVVCILLLSLHSLPTISFFSRCLEVCASPAMLSAGLCTDSHVITRRPKCPLAGEDCALVNPQRIQVFSNCTPGTCEEIFG